MEVDFEKVSEWDRYKVLTSVIVPRPIALVTSVGRSGVVNAAPFSFFNMVGSDPPLVILGLGRKKDGSLKDTARNIVESGEFVVNLVGEGMEEAMNICAVDFPSGESEVAAAGLETEAGLKVKVPRLVASPANLECRFEREMEIGENQLFIGEIVHLRVRDELIDMEKMQVSPAYAPIGRLGSPSAYSFTRERFELPRMNYAEWLRKGGK